MPDPVTSRGSAAKRVAAGPAGRNAARQPLKTKAEKRAEAKAAKARARARQRLRQRLTIGGAAVVTVALLVGLVLWIGHSSSHPDAAAGASAAPSANPSPSPGPSASPTPFPPVPAGADPALKKQPAVHAGTGTVKKLKTTTLIQGTGAAVQPGQTINVNYVGVTYADGKQFDSSWSRREAFSVQIGAGKVIKGWDEGLIGVKVGSRVQLDIPADQAYGEHPSNGPGGALRFVVDVLSAS